MFYHAASDTYLAPGTGFVLGDVAYPANWLDHASGADIAAIGLTAVTTVGARGDDRFYDNAEVMSAGLITITATLRPLPTIRDDFKNQIDEACGAKRASLVSPGTYIEEEYRRAYEDALAYKAAGYSGAAPSSVASWAAVSGMAEQEAADDIIAVRDQYMDYLDGIRAIRLAGKAAVDTATTPAEFDAALALVINQLELLP